ncbi:MAG: 16S rRNA (adenine(1518)-N(6)/adenine(1519)-N(6))-dimethyltransferase RsmA [Saprospiraceae bacterium]|nr:16S rRNA (adenine(1518)-N(6)/adenine(1519)-N(6))-dimethyltransferase RsmA [Saprospiraceae bacterium]MCB0675825.1 16S rRNA (adenine(1518)-N(6)/adenine(1519)-N(6))-dimethyltransferase RsmA [Saprospiraceae bacterium]MCB0681969.1 16S rRNA (adenine(1518)-N(6)/adenine(1519)-N(6))-dimethyltransferase RsmA [Saprospiraceae bacterium]
MKPKKSYGQHFLTSEQIAARIAHSLRATDLYDQVLEVGPGQGMLTKHLLVRNLRLTVVEADPDMVAHLQEHYPELEGQIVAADFLRLALDERMSNRPFGLIGNFPYNISSQILFKMLDYRHLIPEMVGMFQREMAERVIAPEGSKTYGVISVLVQAYYTGEYLFTVKPGSFHPPPKVQSAVIRLERKASLELNCDEALFKRVVKQAFGQRRKMLRNTLKSLVDPAESLQDDFFQQRPEQLSVADFVWLTNWIAEHPSSTT